MKKKIIIIISLILIAILILGGIFGIAIYRENKKEQQKSWEKIIEPDRIVYKNSDGNYYQYEKETDKYNKIINILKNSITSYEENGKLLSENEIDVIHEKNFLEFDYKTASKNYIFNLSEDNGNVIKLATSGGNIISEKINKQKKIKKILDEISQDEEPQKLEYKIMISKKHLNYFNYEDRQKFKEINYKIHQVKITNINDYNKYADMCDVVFEEKITEDTFKNNVVIITISSVPKIDVKVSVGNIKYTYAYGELGEFNGTYVSHALIVNKIANSDCIYNIDESEIENKVYLDKTNVDYDKAVENIDEDTFVKDYDKFLAEYNNSKSQITKEQAKEIAEKGFKEAERICGKGEEETQTVKEENVRANNFFTRKTKEGDKTYKDLIECYVFTRTDDMLNGVSIYVDKRLGKIIGGGAFGD